jgi:WD40 repeat protein
MAAKLQAKHLKTYTGHQSAVYALCADGSGGFFSASGDGMLVHWEAGKDDGQLVAKVPGNVFSMLYNEEENQLLAGSGEGDLFVITDVFGSNPGVRRFLAHNKGLYRLLNIPDGLLSAGGDGRILRWDRQFEITAEINNSGAATRALCLDESGNLWAGSSDFFIRVYDADAKLQKTLQGHTQSVFDLCALPENRMLSGGRDATLKVWSETAELQQTIPAHLLHIHSIKMHPEGKWFATGSMDKTMKIWDTNSLELLKVIDRDKQPFHSSSVNTLIWLDETRILSAGDDRRIVLTEVKD